MILPYDMNELTNALWYYTYHMVHYDTGQLEVPTNYIILLNTIQKEGTVLCKIP